MQIDDISEAFRKSLNTHGYESGEMPGERRNISYKCI